MSVVDTRSGTNATAVPALMSHLLAGRRREWAPRDRAARLLDLAVREPVPRDLDMKDDRTTISRLPATGL
jgi:hypothetical protein